MKLFSSIAVLIGMSSAGVLASAATLTLASFGTTASAPAGVSNTALTLGTSGATYNVPTGGVWANPVGSSSWVSWDPHAYPYGGTNPNPGTYSYFTTFTDTTPGTSSGTITVMADDTTAVYLNGVLITADSSASGPAQYCTVGQPNCTMPATYNLTGFIAGTNTLEFDVKQLYGNAQGIDFSATVNTTAVPEPGTLTLLGMGLLSAVVTARRRPAAHLIHE